MRVILITGANGGLGQAIARAFLAESPENFVWLGTFVRRDAADKLAGEFEDRCRAIELDVTQPASWKTVLETILAEHKRIDVLVNNAGKHHDSLLATMPLNTWESVLKINLDSTFYGCQSVMSAMVSQRSGRIINISSLSAILPPAGQTNYAAAKAGVAHKAAIRPITSCFFMLSSFRWGAGRYHALSGRLMVEFQVRLN